MLFFWRIRYLDSRDRQFKGRDLYLDTSTLDPATRAAVECASEAAPDSSHRWVFKFRHLFRKDTMTHEDRHRLAEVAGPCDSFSVPDYLEDENCQRLSSPSKIGQMLTGDPNVVSFPSYYRPQDIELYFAAPTEPVDFNMVLLSQAEVDCLAYFTRDVKEMRASEFFKNGAGTLHQAGGPYELKTATTPDEVRSFVSVFRRLYMAGEPGCFRNAATVFADKVPHPTARWMRAELADYGMELARQPDFYPPRKGIVATFTHKKILDAFIYTKFAHQPQEARIRQYNEYLGQVPSEVVLTWLFLETAHRMSLYYSNALQHVGPFIVAYLRTKNVQPSFSATGLHEASGLGSVEKRAARANRVLREKAEELAMKLWQDAGNPSGGPAVFLRDAERQIRERLET